jgi:hypothetical protein
MLREFPQFYRWLLPRLNLMLTRFPNAQPTSWYRDRASNIAVGGAEFSQHRLGWAADFSLPRDEHLALVQLAQGFGMVAIDEGDHVHVQMYPAGVVPRRFFPTL